MADRFEKLFSPNKIGKLECKNRIVMPAMETSFATEEGFATDRLINYYAERAKGGAGLVIVEVSCVSLPLGRQFKRHHGISDDRYLPSLTKLATAIKSNGARASIQLHHGGGACASSLIGAQPVGPSAVARKGYETPRELSISEIGDIVKSYVSAADRAKRAGFDAVEVHAVHDCLLTNFLSPSLNRRTDKYGGSVANRARIVVEIVQGIKEKLGDFPVTCRINGIEAGMEYFGPDMKNFSLEDAKEVARLVEKAGADALNVSCFGYGAHALDNLPETPGALLPYAETVKGVVSIPVINAGKLNPELGEKAIREGKTDFVAMGRTLIADPYLPSRAREGKLEEIRPCIACSKCLTLDFEKQVRGAMCSVNPHYGWEGQYDLKPVQSPKKVMVIGGGPAGMEAAYAAAIRGHKVSLFEAGTELGGQLLYADKPPGKERITAFKQFLIGRLKRSGVTVTLKARITPESVAKQRPDVVILATGATPFTPDIKGITKSKKVVSAWDVLAGRADTGERVVIIGGELVGCETAHSLAEKGKKVTVCEIAGRSLLESLVPYPYVRYPLLSTLRKLGVHLATGVTYKEVTADGLSVIDSEGKPTTFPADTIVVAAGAVPAKELGETIGGKIEVKLAGDCVKPRSIMEAIREGFKAGLEIA